jgi:hypothetical protein
LHFSCHSTCESDAKSSCAVEANRRRSMIFIHVISAVLTLCPSIA